MSDDQNSNTITMAPQLSDFDVASYPSSEGVATSPVKANLNGTSDHPESSINLESLFERADRQIPDSLIESMLEEAPRFTLYEERAADGLVTLLRSRSKCLKPDKATTYDKIWCPNDDIHPLFKPMKKQPCKTRGHHKCEGYWSRREAKKRSRKLEVFTKARGGTTLLYMDWDGTDGKQREKAWRAFRRSKKHPVILKRASYFPVETAWGRRIVVVVPKLYLVEFAKWTLRLVGPREIVQYACERDIDPARA